MKVPDGKSFELGVPVFSDSRMSKHRDNTADHTRDSMYSPFRTTGIPTMRQTADAGVFGFAKGSMALPNLD